MMGPGIRKTQSERRANDELDELLADDLRSVEDLTAERRQEDREAGERLMQARMRAKWSRRKLAGALNVSRRQLQDWEENGGRNSPPLRIIAKLGEHAPVVCKEFLRVEYRRLKSTGTE